MSTPTQILAKKLKKDEYYTLYEDIECELIHYIPHFKDKVVYCNCDSEKSNFYRFFTDNFSKFQLKKLICTHYNSDNPDQQSYMIVRDREHEEVVYLAGNGDFRSPGCKMILNNCDIVVTNPPYSLFRQFLKLLMEYNKKFIILGNINAVTYKDVFPLIKENKIRLGVNSRKGSRKGDSLLFLTENGEKENTSSWWYTNLEYAQKFENIPMVRTYNDTDYPKYDNYDAIEVSKVKNIPSDYFGTMGVPISYLKRHNPNQFEIIGLAKRGGDADKLATKIYTKPEYPNASDLNAGPTLWDGDRLYNCYARLLIRRKS